MRRCDEKGRLENIRADTIITRSCKRRDQRLRTSEAGMERVKSVLCPTCGCSLVRLRISRHQAIHLIYDRAEHHFCCKGCAEIFSSDPERYLAQIRDVVVCPGCFGEKPAAVTVSVEHSGRTVNFCGCPHCQEAFDHDPEGLLARLEEW
jgi:YHS domain-containing protein